MPLSVSSWFVDKCKEQSPDMLRRFTIGSTDYSDYVTRWPAITNSTKSVLSRSVTIKLANEDQTFNSFLTTPLNLKQNVCLEFGFPSEGFEYKERTTLSTTNPASQDFSGVCVAITEDAEFIASGSVGRTGGAGNNEGQIELFQKQAGGGYTSVFSLTDPLAGANRFWGAYFTFLKHTSVHSSAPYLFAGQQRYGTPDTDSSVSSEGIAYVYVMSQSNGFPTLVASLQPSAPNTFANFGQHIDATVYDHGSHKSMLVAVAAPFATVSSLSRAGEVTIWEGSFDNNFFTELQTIQATDPTSKAWFGSCVDFSTNGERLFTVAPYKVTSGFQNSGSFYVDVRSTNGFYGGHAPILINSPTANQFMGNNGDFQNNTIASDYAGKTVGVGSPWRTQIFVGSTSAFRGSIDIFVESTNGVIEHNEAIFHNGDVGLKGMGSALHMTYSGDLMLAGMEREDTHFPGDSNGATIAFVRDASSAWIQKPTIYAQAPSQFAEIGYMADMTPSGDVYVSGAVDFGYTSHDLQSQGRAYLFTNVDTRAYHAEEVVNLFEGTIESVTYPEGGASMKVRDALKSFGDRQIGSKDDTVVFSSTTLLPSDLFWTICTCYGGLSNVESTSNPDIDYTAFQAWASVFSSDTVIMHGSFDGEKVLEGLRKIARYTDSSIVEENTKLIVKRYGVNSGSEITFSDSNNNLLKTPQPTITDFNMVNKQYVLAGYNVDSESHAIETFDASTVSINSYGLREFTEKDNSIWYTNSISALNLAQRKISLGTEPRISPKIPTLLHGAFLSIGDVVTVVDSLLNISSELYRIVGYKKDMDSGKIVFDTTDAMISDPFILDESLLDGPDLLL